MLSLTYRHAPWRVALALLLALLAGCAPEPAAPDEPEADQAGLNPDAIVRSFFDDLVLALGDPELADTDVRVAWAARLADYFAPNERADQRAMLRASLYNFWLGQEQVRAEDQTVALEIDYESLRVEMSADRQRANVVLEGGVILVRYTTIGQTEPDYESRVAIANVLGNPDGSVPTVNVGGRWYLTEG